ncbi:AAA family ATPase [Streptosporangium sp. NPDC023615]|uniref:nSTAND1 domain-containing NTPase n=1 Tax=Streptosporangium sp. NPDC023615 TaxID=3154794 RepID=UPI00341C81F6
MTDDVPEVMRGGVARAVRSAGARVRQWTPPVLLAVLSAGAFAPLLASAVSPLLAAGLGAVAAVGGNLLTDIVKAGVAKLGNGKPSQDEIQDELERRFQEILTGGGADAAALRAELARVLREFGLVGAAIEAAVRSGDQDLQTALTAGLAELGAEFAFVLSDVEGQLRLIREGVDRQRAELQVAVGLQYRQATDTRLLLDQLAVIERRTRQAGETNARDGVRWVDGSPYKGLATYTEADAEVFTGRELVTAQLVSTLSERLAGPGLLVLTGASGAGKSSLLRAGLFPAIGRGDLSEPAARWPRHILDEPTRSPLAALATLLASLAGLAVPAVLDALRAAPQDAALLVRQAVGPAGRLILVVDQFEEIFAIDGPGADAERAAFVTALHAAATVPGVGEVPAALVVIAVRGDVIDRCAAFPQLIEALRNGLFVLGAMTEAELRTAIIAPAAAAGLQLEPGLADTILGELRAPAGGYDAGVLPLLSQTMLTVWEHREGDRLTSRGYARTGGVTRAVATSAELAYDGLNPAGQELTRRLFQRLTAVSPDGRLTRRTMPLTDEPGLAEVLEVYAGRRLIVADTGSVQIAHDALLTNWPRLRGWLESDLTGHALRSQLIDDAAEWDANSRAAAYLYRGERLAAALGAEARRRDDPLTGAAALFLDAGVRAEIRSRRQRRRTLALLSGLLAVAVLLAGIAVVQVRAAWQERQAAQEQQRVAIARQLIAKAEAALDTDPRTALLLNVAAHRIHPDPETYAALQRAITTTPYAGQLTGVRSGVSSIAYAHSGRYLAAGFDSGAVMLWDLRDPLRPRQVGTPFTDPGTAEIAAPYIGILGFSAGDDRLISGIPGGPVTIWDLADPARPRRLGRKVIGEPYQQGGAWLSPDGSVLATSSKKTPGLQLWDLSKPGHIRKLGSRLDARTPIVELAFSPDGDRIAMVGSAVNDEVTIWDLRLRQRLGSLSKPKDYLGSLAFSADGGQLAVGGWFKGVALWQVRDPAAPRAMGTIAVSAIRTVFATRGTALAVSGLRDTGTILYDTADPSSSRQTDRLRVNADPRDMVFSPDGRMIAGGDDDGRITLWNLQRAGRPVTYGPPFVGHQDGAYKDIYALALSADGSMVATGGRDTTVELWDTADPARPRKLSVLTGHHGPYEEGAVGDATFAPDGTVLATGDSTGTVILWDLADRARPRRLAPSLTGPTGIIRSILYSPDGATLIVGGDNGTIFWDVRNPTRPRRLALILDQLRVLGLWRVKDGRVLAVVKGSDIQPESDPPDRLAVPATGAPDGEKGVRLWDITDPARPRQLGSGLIGHRADVDSAALSPSGDLLITGDNKGAAIIWDLSDPARARRLGDPLVPHGSRRISLAIAPSSDIMVTGGIEGNAYLWDLGNRILPRQLGIALAANLDDVEHTVFSADGDTLAISGSRGDVVLWDLRPMYDLRSRLAATTCLVTGGGLNREQWTRYAPALPYQDICAQ